MCSALTYSFHQCPGVMPGLIRGMAKKAQLAAYACRDERSLAPIWTKTEPEPGVKVTFHAFPLNDKDLCDKWIRANPRKDFVPTKYSKLCFLHLLTSNFIKVRSVGTATMIGRDQPNNDDPPVRKKARCCPVYFYRIRLIIDPAGMELLDQR